MPGISEIDSRNHPSANNSIDLGKKKQPDDSYRTGGPPDTKNDDFEA